jgi:hypothetical protein
MYDEPNIDMMQKALKEAQEIDVDALREYAEQVSQIDEKTPLKTALSICGVHGQNPDPKLVVHQQPEKPVIQDEFSFIPDPTMTDVLNNSVFESQEPVTETVLFNLKDPNQPTVQPSEHTIIANKIQEILNDINKQPELFLDVRYYLTQAMQTAKNQTLDQTSGQPYYWNYIADTVPIGKNAVLVSVNGYGQEALLCYNTRTLFIVDNKLIKLKDPQTYSRTVWRYVHQCIDEHPSFWVYNTNIKPLSNDQRKSHLLAFYQKDMYKNRWK